MFNHVIQWYMCRIYGKGRKTDMKGIEKGWQFNWCSGVCVDWETILFSKLI